MSNRLAGIANITINGTTVEVVGNFTWTSQNFRNEPLTSMSDPYPGYKQTLMPATLKFEGRDQSDTALSFYSNLTDATIVAVLANGKTLTMTNADLMEQPTVNESEATMELSFAAETITEGTISS
jgi:hypothetical protein